MSDESEDVSFNQAIASFMSACIPIEKGLQAGKPLTEVELSSIIVTIQGLETALFAWKQKNDIPFNRPL